MILRRDYVAFVPDTFVQRPSQAKMAADLAIGVGLALVGVGTMRVAARPPVAALLARALACSEEHFDAVVTHMAAVLGGDVVGRSDASIEVEPQPGGRASRVSVSAPAGKYVGSVERVHADWIAHVVAPSGGFRS